MAEVPGARPDRLDKETACNSAANRTLTPNLDALAARGLRLTDFHATGVCTPSRAQLQTGRMGARTGVSSNFGPGSLGGLPQTETTLASLLKRSATPYATCAIGKWHLGVKPGFHPLDHGYDTFLGLPESNDYGCTDSTMGAPDSGCLNWRDDRCPRNRQETSPKWDGRNCHPGPLNPWNYSLPLLHDRRVVQQPADLQGTATPDAVPLSFRYAEFAASFIKNTTTGTLAAKKQQFLVYIAWSHMHVPVVHGLQFTGKSGIGPLGDSLLEVDTAAGMVLDALDKHGVAKDTLVFLTGDNGCVLPPRLFSLLRLPSHEGAAFTEDDRWPHAGPQRTSATGVAQKGRSSERRPKLRLAAAAQPGSSQCGSACPLIFTASPRGSTIWFLPERGHRCLQSWEGGHREVGVVVWPGGGVQAGAVSHVLSTTMDIAPTVSALAGVPLPTDRIYDGKDLSPVLFDGAAAHHEHLFFSVGGESFGNVPGGKPCAGAWSRTST